jgi:hypothetical protein
MRLILLFGIAALAASQWWAAASILWTDWQAGRTWHRVIGETSGVADQMHLTVKVERGIEFTRPVPKDLVFAENERILDMEYDHGLKNWRRVEFLINPATGKARVAGWRFSALLPASLGLVYLVFGAGFWLVTSSFAPTEPGNWVYYQSPPWSGPAVVSARSAGWPILNTLAIALCLFVIAMVWTSVDSPAKRAASCSVVVVIAGTYAVLTIGRVTRRIEADGEGLRESSALGWRRAPWGLLRGAVDETVSYYGKRSPSSRSSSMLDHVTHRVYFTNQEGQEIVTIDDDLDPEQRKALLDHVLSRTGLQPEKREIKRNMFSYRQ